jgi:hypothetical protein
MLATSSSVILKALMYQAYEQPPGAVLSEVRFFASLTMTTSKTPRMANESD